MKEHKHLIEHHTDDIEEGFLGRIGGAALTPEESIFPHLEGIRESLPEYMRSAFEVVIKKYAPETIKPWAVFMLSFCGSKKIDDLYANGMDDVID